MNPAVRHLQGMMGEHGAIAYFCFSWMKHLKSRAHKASKVSGILLAFSRSLRVEESNV
jgi:hypothetical protein